MKILFAVQGTGNGHISRARTILPLLQNYGEVDVLISGTQADVGLTEVKYYKKGVSFVFGKNGGVDNVTTFRKLHPITLMRDALTIPLEQYDLLINDFEPVTALAAKIKEPMPFASFVITFSFI